MTGDSRPATRPSPAVAATGGRAAWLAVTVLFVVGTLNYLDRELPFILGESMKADLGLSDTQLGFITGLSFTLVYAVMGLPLARLSDRGGHGWVIATSAAFWSLMTAAAGVSQTFWQLALSRMGVALGESGSTPAAHAFIARNFKLQQRGLPLAVVSLAAPVGAMLGLLGGGLLAASMSWRGSFMLIGAIGIGLALLVPLTVRSSDAGPRPQRTPALAGMGEVLRNRSYRRVVLGAAVIAFANYACAAFAPSFLRRSYGMDVREVGLAYGLTKGFLGAGGLIVAGYFVNRLAARKAHWIPRMPALIALCALPFTALIWLGHDKVTGILGMGAANAVGLAYLAATVFCVQSLAPPHLRATASAMFLFANAMFGGAGPLVVGALSDLLQPHLGAHALREALLVVPAGHVLAAIIYWHASKDFVADVYRDDGSTEPGSSGSHVA